MARTWTGILRNGGAINFSMGHAGVRHVQGRAAGIGIVYQVNLEYLAKGVLSQPQLNNSQLFYPDTSSHGFAHDDDQRIGIVGWGRRRHRSGERESVAVTPRATRRSCERPPRPA